MQVFPQGCAPPSFVMPFNCCYLLWSIAPQKPMHMHKHAKVQMCLQVNHFTAERSLKAIRVSAIVESGRI